MGIIEYTLACVSGDVPEELFARVVAQYGEKGAVEFTINAIALRLNQRPRKTLGFDTPADKLQEVLRRPVEPAILSTPFTSFVAGPAAD